MVRFNPRTRVGCDSLLRGCVNAWLRFQSTHPRGVRPEPPGARSVDNGFQSTHPRGVRLPHKTSTLSISGFQSTHPRGVRPMDRILISLLLRFNPRTRVGCDVAEYWPARGLYEGFNPRTRVGCDEPDYNGWLDAHGVSIHAPAWGATSFGSRHSTLNLSFNPRTRVGCDFIVDFILSLEDCFNPRTRVGCDLLF